MSERLLPLPMTTLVTTDLIGVTRGRSFRSISSAVLWGCVSPAGLARAGAFM